MIFSCVFTSYTPKAILDIGIYQWSFREISCTDDLKEAMLYPLTAPSKFKHHYTFHSFLGLMSSGVIFLQAFPQATYEFLLLSFHLSSCLPSLLLPRSSLSTFFESKVGRNECPHCVVLYIISQYMRWWLTSFVWKDKRCGKRTSGLICAGEVKGRWMCWRDCRRN